MREEFIPELREEAVRPRRFNGAERHAIDAWGTVVLFGQCIGGTERFQFADVDVQAPEAPRLVSLRLEVYLSSQVLQRAGQLCHLAPASHIAERCAAQ